MLNFLEAGTGAAANAMGGFTTIFMIIAMLGVMYFLMIRPENKRKKEAEQMRNELRVGDEIVTIGGICGKVTNVKDETITIISAESKMTFLKTAVASVTAADNE